MDPSLYEIFQAVVNVAKTVDGIETGYPVPPDAAPPQANLPAVLIVPGEFQITGGDSELWSYTWQMHALIEQGDDLAARSHVLLPFLKPIVVAFRSQTTLGLPNTYGVHIDGGVLGAVAYLDATYLAITYRMSGKQKFSATYD